MNKNLVLLLLIVVGASAWYAKSVSDKKQTDLLKSQVEALRKETDALEAKAQSTQQVVAKDAAAASKRLADLQAKLAAENAKLTAFQTRKSALVAAINDPAMASSLNEAENEIKEKNDAIESLQLQLTNTQDYEKTIEHNGEAAKQMTSLSKSQAIGDLNARIRAQEELIRNTRENLRAMNVPGNTSGLAQVPALQANLAQQRADLATLKASKDQVNVATAAQTVQIHQQVGYEKNNVRASAEEIRAQITTLKVEVKALQAQRGGATKSKEQLRTQSAYLDQQIAASRTEITRIQNLIATESKN